jgi:hypothetical protein
MNTAVSDRHQGNLQRPTEMAVVAKLAASGAPAQSQIFILNLLKCDVLATDPEVRVRFPALPDFLRSNGSGTVSTQPREYNLGAALKRK